MTLIATPKAINANSFATLEQANAYHDARLHNSDWDNASDENKIKALKMATRLLDNINYMGRRTDDDQSLSWPRYSVYEDGILLDDDTIPQSIIDATSEQAWLLLIKDTTRDSGDKGYKKVKVGPIEIDTESSDRPGSVASSVKMIMGSLVAPSNTVKVYRG